MERLEWNQKRIMITGGGGFLGRHLVRRIESKKPAEIFVPRSKDYDLRNPSDISKVLAEGKPDVLIHAAARVGGIGANRAEPAGYFYDNLIMGALLMEQALRAGVEKFVTIGSVCAYPKFAAVPFREEELWNGFPEETNAPYGVAKRALLVQGIAYNQQYGFNIIHLMPANLYGPGDDFDPFTSHVIPSLIRRCLEAVSRGDTSIEVWGTGSASREFIFVDDAAEGIVLATERYDSPEPVNLGSGNEILVRDLVSEIARLTGYDGSVVWDPTKPDGQPRRRLDVSRARDKFGFRATTLFEDGLRQTVDWYQSVRTGS